MTITKENLKDLIGESDVSEDTLLKIKIMVESALAEKLDEQAKTLAEQNEVKLTALQAELDEAKEIHAAEIQSLHEKANQYAQYVVTEMTEKIDSYAEYVVEKFIEDNKQTLVESDEYNRMKTVFESIKLAFEGAHFALVPTDTTSELEASLAEVRESYNGLCIDHEALKKENTEMQFAMVFESLTSDLAETQKEKLKALVENVSFTDVSEFKRGVELMIGQVTESKTAAVIAEAAEGEEVQDSPAKASRMSRYLSI